MTAPNLLQMRRTANERATRVRQLWWATIRDLPAAEVRAALLQMLADIDELTATRSHRLTFGFRAELAGSSRGIHQR